MEKHKLNSFNIVILSLVISFLASCGGSPTPQIAEEADLPSADKADIPGLKPATPTPEPCVGEFDPPQLISPNMEIIDPNPPYTFTWIMPNCQPKEYNIKVHYSPYTSGPTVINENFFSLTTQYSINTPLQPATTYDWRLIAFPYNPQSNWQGSNYATFTTGPLCAPGELVAPTLISPSNGAIDPGKGWGNITEVHTVIAYPIETCTPEGFMIFVSDNADFTGQNWNVYSPGPYYKNYEKTEDGAYLIGDDTNDLNDCSYYYWHAWAFVGNTDGPMSETFSFYTDFEGNCIKAAEFKGIKNANCRSNPWINGNEVGLLRKDETAKLLGVNEDGFWGFFELMNGLKCWVHLSTVEMQPPGAVFDPSMYPLIPHDPAPEPNPPEPPKSSCKSDLDRKACADAGGTYTCGAACFCECP